MVFMQFVLHDTIFECHTCSLPHRYLLKRQLRPYCFLMYFSVPCFFGICNNNDIGYKMRTQDSAFSLQSHLSQVSVNFKRARTSSALSIRQILSLALCLTHNRYLINIKWIKWGQNCFWKLDNSAFNPSVGHCDDQDGI